MSNLKTITFDELRARNNHAFEKRNYAPVPVLEQPQKEQRAAILQLITCRTEIEKLASTRDQREGYGIEQWDEQFIRLREVRQEHPHINFKGEKLRWYIWNRVPNSRFKRFQEAFCHPYNFIVPRFEITKNGQVLFSENPDFNQLSLAPCLVSPDLIPEDFAEDHLGLDFTGDIRKTLERLKKKRDIDKITRLKKIWESAVPLQEDDYRILMIQAPGNEQNKRYPQVEGPDPSTIGTILYTHEDTNNRHLATPMQPQKRGEPQPPRKLKVLHFKSAYAAHRETVHVEQTYTREIKLLTKMQNELGSLIITLNGWKRDTLEERKEEMRGQAQELLTRLRDLLIACENKYKVRACDLLTDIEDLKDSSEKDNVTACMAKMVGAINASQKRFGDIQSKGGYNRQDQTSLQECLRQHEQAFKIFRANIQAGAPKLQDPSLKLFNGERLSLEQVGSEVGTLMKDMGIQREEPDGVELAPFRIYANRLREKCDALEAALTFRNRELAMDALTKMDMIGKFQATRTCIEHIRRHSINPETMNVKRIRELVCLINELFSQRQLFPDRAIDGYQTHFEALRQKLEALSKILPRKTGEDLGCLRNHLKRFDNLEEMVQSLP